MKKWRMCRVLLPAISLLFIIYLVPAVFSEPSSEESEEGKNETPINVAAEWAKPQGLEYIGGRPKKLTEAPKRIIALFPQSIALIPLFKLNKQVVGMPLSKLGASFHEGGFLQSAFPEAANCPDVGFPGKPNLEIIVGLKPDLVILPYFHQKAENQLNLLKVPRFRMFGTFADLDQWLEAVKLFGEVVHKPEIAEAYCNWVREKTALVRLRLSSRPGGPHKRPRVLRVLKAGKRYIAYGARMELGNEILRLCDAEAFGADVKRGGDGVFSIEEALAFDPDYIFVDSTPNSQAAPEIELNEPFWKQLRAFRENRVFRVPIDDETCFVTGWYFNLPAPLGLLWTAKTLYPDIFADIDLDAEARWFYKNFFQIDRDRMVEASRKAAANTPRKPQLK